MRIEGMRRSFFLCKLSYRLYPSVFFTVIVERALVFCVSPCRSRGRITKVSPLGVPLFPPLLCVSFLCLVMEHVLEPQAENFKPGSGTRFEHTNGSEGWPICFLLWKRSPWKDLQFLTSFLLRHTTSLFFVGPLLVSLGIFTFTSIGM